MSQGSYNVPTGGSVSMVTFAGLMNAAYNALASQHSGASAPANGPSGAPLEFQTWADTTDVNYPALKVFDGANWDRVGTLDVAGSNWLPKMGGGATSVASATTTDIGASPETYLTITGSATITSLGTAAAIGEERKLTFSGNAVLTYGASSIVTPGLANITTQPGDCCTAIYQGAGLWVLWGYTRGLNAPGFSLPTGGVFWMPTKNLAVSGAVKANGRTIGDASSSATELASATTKALFYFLYDNFSDALCPVSGGRGTDAEADFAAHKRITLPDLRGMVIAGLDDMGNSAASRLTSLTMTPDGITALATGGAQTVTLLTANLPPYTPAGSISSTDAGHTHGPGNGTYHMTSPGVGGPIAGGGSFTYGLPTATASGTASITSTFTGSAQGGTSTAVNKVQPTVLGTWYLVL